MRIKTKISLVLGLLFLLIVLLIAVATVFLNALSSDSQNILTDNYNTIDYSRNMLLALEQTSANRGEAFTAFAENLEKQHGNVTEDGEQELTQSLAVHFNRLQENSSDTTTTAAIRSDLYEIMKLNMEAIVRKSEIARETAISAKTWIAFTGTLCFVIAFILLINLPGNIADPIRELTESIRQVAAKNYHQRVHFHEQNEFGELAKAFNTMAHKLEEYDGSNLASLLLEKKRIETLINNMNDPVIGLDAEKKIIFANHEALKILDATSADIVGQPALQVALHNDLMRILVAQLEPQTDQKAKAPLRIYTAGKESYFEKETHEIVITPTGERTRRHLGHVILLRNVTPFKELDFAKTNFIATISHELKTPISSIKLSLKLLEKQGTGQLNRAQQQLTESIGEDANRLLKITAELLNMAQAESGNIQLNILPSDPQSMLKYALDTVRTQAEEKQIQLDIQADDSLPAVKADPDKTVWVLVNLLTNAIHYSPEQNKILISLQKEPSALLFSVRDFGKGIDARYRDRVFERYFQVPGSLKSGAGLGLAICREFIEAQGGSIGVESELGLGSRFYFRLAV